MKIDTDEWADWLTLPPHWKPWPLPKMVSLTDSREHRLYERRSRQTMTLTFVGMGLAVGAAMLYWWVNQREVHEPREASSDRGVSLEAQPDARPPHVERPREPAVDVESHRASEEPCSTAKEDESEDSVDEAQLAGHVCDVPTPGYFYRVREGDELRGEAGVAARALRAAVLDVAAEQRWPTKKAQTKANGLADHAGAREAYTQMVTKSRWNAECVPPLVVGELVWLPPLRREALVDRSRRRRVAVALHPWPDGVSKLEPPPQFRVRSMAGVRGDVSVHGCPVV